MNHKIFFFLGTTICTVKPPLISIFSYSKSVVLNFPFNIFVVYCSRSLLPKDTESGVFTLLKCVCSMAGGSLVIMAWHVFKLWMMEVAS